ncbi:MAG: hypothetical protein KGJ06_05230, partial [Pseudomonadota bacterium]|nr:hypothetical protein [Pseudomonadota bacterium]
TVQIIDALVDLAFKDWRLVKPGTDPKLLPPTSYEKKFRQWKENGKQGAVPEPTKRERAEGERRLGILQNYYEKDFLTKRETRLALRVLKVLDHSFARGPEDAGEVEGANRLFFRSFGDKPGQNLGLQM